MQITASCAHKGQRVDIFMDGEKLTEVVLDAPEYDIKKFFKFKSAPFKVAPGVHEIRSIICGATTLDSVHHKKWEFIKRQGD